MLTKMALMTGEVVNNIGLTDFDLDSFFDFCVSGIEKILPLFTKFPINIFFIGGPLVGLVIGIFTKVKRTASRK